MAFSRKQSIRQAHETIDCAIRTYDVEPVLDSVVVLASNNSFDEFYRVGCLFLESQDKPTNGLWDRANSLSQHPDNNIASLTHLVRLELARYELEFRGDASYAINTVSDALIGFHYDKDVILACERVISCFPYELEHDFYSVLELIKKS